MIDFDEVSNIRFLAVREFRLRASAPPNLNHRAHLVWFVNYLPLVFIELKANFSGLTVSFLLEAASRQTGAWVSSDVLV